MIAPEAGLSISRQCTLLGVARSSFYDRPRPESAEELELLKRLDRIFTDCPVYGSRRLQVALLREGISMGRRRVRRLMRKLGLWAVRPKREYQQAASRAQGLPIPSARQDDRPGEPEPALAKAGVWAADITYIAMRQGFLYLVAIIDWATRRVLSWRVSNTLTAGFRGAERGPRPVRQARHLQYRSEPALAKAGGRNSPVMSSPRCCGIMKSRSAWTDAGAATTTSSSSACGGP